MPRLATLLLITTALAQGVVAQVEAVHPLIAEGDSAFAAFDNALATDRYERALSAVDDPDEFDLLAKLSRTVNDYGMDLVAEGREDEGERVLDRSRIYAERLAELYPNRPESWFLLAAADGNLALFRGGRGKVRVGRNVERFSLEAIRLDPAFAPPYVVLGIFYREIAELSWIQRALAKTLLGGLPRGTYEMSEDMLRSALERDDTIPLAHFELARTLIRSDRTKEAVPYLRRAIELPPKSTLDIRNREEARRIADSL